MKNVQKTFMMFLSILFLLGLAGNSYAKSNNVVKGKTIFDYKKELNLTNKQIVKIKQAIITLNKKTTLLKAKLIIANSNLQKLLNERGDISAIDKQLRSIFDYRREMIIADLIASRVVKGTLTSKQLAKWKEIQSKNRKK